jgi:hypothetical protein
VVEQEQPIGRCVDNANPTDILRGHHVHALSDMASRLNQCGVRWKGLLTASIEAAK